MNRPLKAIPPQVEDRFRNEGQGTNRQLAKGAENGKGSGLIRKVQGERGLDKQVLPFSPQLPNYTVLRRIFLSFNEHRERFHEIDSTSLCSLAGRYDNHMPTRFLGLTD